MEAVGEPGDAGAETDRLLELADGRLSSVLAPAEGSDAAREEQPNPGFVFRRPLGALLRAVRARQGVREIRSEGVYTHAVEPVTFVRHRQAEAVLRHVWREYGQLSELLADWLGQVARHSELTRPVGQVMGLASSWGGGRRALRHIESLAKSDRPTSRLVAAHALGIAAEDPVLVAEVRYRLNGWSVVRNPNLRATVAFTCGAEFGLSRPDFALRLLRTLATSLGDGSGETGVLLAVRTALGSLFQSGNEQRVVEQLAEWMADEHQDAGRLLTFFPPLLQDSRWFQQELAGRTDHGRRIVDLTRTALNSDATFDATCRALLRWCDGGRWDEVLAQAVKNLFGALADPMEHGALRLFVEVDRSDVEGLAGAETARSALHGWRNGTTGRPSGPDGAPSGPGSGRAAA